MADEEIKPPVARIVSPKEREKMVPLEYPVEFDGVLYEQVKVRRASGKEVQAYMDRMRNGDANAVPPMVDCPQEVWDAMDDDDQVTVDQAARPFWPRRLNAALGLIQETGEAS